MLTKKLQTVTMLFVVFILVLSACSSPQPASTQASSAEQPATEESAAEQPATEQPAQEPAAGQAVELSILHNWGEDDAKGPILQGIVEAFMQENPDIIIKQEIIPETEIVNKVEVAFVGGKEPDLVFQNYFGPTLAWVDDGVTVPVTSYIEAWGLNEYYLDAALAQYTRSDGQIAAFPVEGFNWPIWYNKAIFDEAGVAIPTTSEEMLNAATAIRAAGYQPFAIGGSDWTGARMMQMFLVSGIPDAEAQELLANGGFANSANALKTMEAFVAWRDGGVFADNAEGLEFSSMNELFFSSKAAMVHGGSWSYAELPAELQESVMLGGLPLTDLGAYDKPTAWAGFTAKGVHITRNGVQKIDAVERFVRFLMKPENIAKFVEQGGMIPPYNSVDVDESVLNPLFVKSLDLPATTTFVTLAETIIPGSAIELLDKVANDAFIPNGLSAQEILDAMDQVYEENK